MAIPSALIFQQLHGLKKELEDERKMYVDMRNTAIFDGKFYALSFLDGCIQSIDDCLNRLANVAILLRINDK